MIIAITAIVLISTLIIFTALTVLVYKKNIHIWFSSYITSLLCKNDSTQTEYASSKSYNTDKKNGPKHIMFCFVDHFEPMWRRPSYETEVSRIRTWKDRYPVMAGKHKDADGKNPQHTFFYPEEEYRKEHLDELAMLCKAGFGEIEIHLHHDDDTAQKLKENLIRFKKKLTRHGLLAKNKNTKETEYGFTHGNWALDNSRNDGKWCGVNNELQILKETGCYADFTLPSAPSETQTKKINSIYYALDDPIQPKSHDKGIDVMCGGKPDGDLMIIQGPLTLNWKDRKLGILPRIENGGISCGNPPSAARVDLWIKQNIHVKGRPDWIFVKVYTHGTQEANFECLLGEPVDKMHSYLGKKYNDGVNYMLHYVTSREMYNIIKAAEEGHRDNPDNFRDHILIKTS